LKEEALVRTERRTRLEEAMDLSQDEQGAETIICVYMYIYIYIHTYTGVRGGAVVEAQRYKPDDRGIDSRWCHWNFSLT
jgi:hypothetical protein